MNDGEASSDYESTARPGSASNTNDLLGSSLVTVPGSSLGNLSAVEQAGENHGMENETVYSMRQQVLATM